MEQIYSLKSKINTVIHHPSIIKTIIKQKKLNEIRCEIDKIDKHKSMKLLSYWKQRFPYTIDTSQKIKLNRLCYLEDWENDEIRQSLSELHKLNPFGFIHRKDWEWAVGIIAMKRFKKLNHNNLAVGVGSGTEPIPFYLANKLKHVYATDLYGERENWKNASPSDFHYNPKNYAPFPYKADALTVLRMNGTKLEFPSETFDIAFSFSSIEHFGGKNHSGSLKSMKEIERILKKDGIAIIATEYIINDKNHPEFFNRKTIYSDLIDKLDSLKLVESLDLRITTKTLDTVMDIEIDANWNNFDNNFKKIHPVILLRNRNILYTSIMLVFKKN
jgi:SAM-dependent methyltransferase